MIDNKTVITGSFNWSPSAAHTNDETLLVIHSHKLAAHFTREMDRHWESAELADDRFRTFNAKSNNKGSNAEMG